MLGTYNSVDHCHPSHRSKQNVHALKMPSQVQAPNSQSNGGDARTLDFDDGPGSLVAGDVLAETKFDECSFGAGSEGYGSPNGEDGAEEEGRQMSKCEVLKHGVEWRVELTVVVHRYRSVSVA